MIDSLTTLSEPPDPAAPIEPVPETAALRAHIERILRKLAPAKPSPRVC